VLPSLDLGGVGVYVPVPVVKLPLPVPVPVAKFSLSELSSVTEAENDLELALCVLLLTSRALERELRDALEPEPYEVVEADSSSLEYPDREPDSVEP
jgi:hypothetical protein